MSDQPPPPRDPTVAVAAFAGALVAFVVVVAWGASPVTRADFPLDDAWIHLDYARGLLRDGLPTYNPGEPEAGFSSPLWMFCDAAALAFSQLTRLPVVLAVKGLSALLGGVAAWALAQGARRHGASARVARVVAFVAPLGPWWCTGAASGMEVTLTALLLALALTAALDGRPRRSGVLLALATLARPECAVAVAAVGALALVARRWGSSLALVAPTAVAALAWGAYDLAVTGHPLPNTFYAKVAHVDLARSAAFLVVTASEDGAAVALLLVGLAVAGLRAAPRRSAALWSALCLAPIAGVLLSRSLDPAVLIYLRRYLYPFLVLLWWPAALGATALADAVAIRLPARARLLASSAVALAVLAVVPSLVAARALHAEQCQDIATFHTAPALAIAARTPADAVVAVEGAGASRYFGGRVTVDLFGLNEHFLVHHRHGGLAHLCHLVARNPTWFVVPDAWVARYASAFAFTGRAVYRSERYAQVDPPARHAVVILSAAPRPGVLARCAAFSVASGASPAAPSGPSATRPGAAPPPPPPSPR